MRRTLHIVLPLLAAGCGSPPLYRDLGVDFEPPPGWILESRNDEQLRYFKQDQPEWTCKLERVPVPVPIERLLAFVIARRAAEYERPEVQIWSDEANGMPALLASFDLEEDPTKRALAYVVEEGEARFVLAFVGPRERFDEQAFVESARSFHRIEPR